MGFFGGDSSSSTTNQTDNFDMRVVGADGSTNVSTNNSDVTIYSTDHGAISAGMAMGNQAINAAAAGAVATQGASVDMFKGALTAVSAAQKDLAQAYQNGQAGDQTQLKYAGFAVVGLAAFMFFKAKS